MSRSTGCAKVSASASLARPRLKLIEKPQGVLNVFRIRFSQVHVRVWARETLGTLPARAVLCARLPDPEESGQRVNVGIGILPWIGILRWTFPKLLRKWKNLRFVLV
jgi:hypothetical protein